MPRLLIIADDFTGALDTGVQFAACGIPTRVVVGTAADMIRCECTVLVVDTETRHLSAEAAGKIVEVLARRARETEDGGYRPDEVRTGAFYSGQKGYAEGDRLYTRVFSRLTALRLPPEGFGVGIALFLLILLGMALHPRFFCQFLCPMGAVFALLPVLPCSLLHRNAENCIPGCSACARRCPVGLKPDAASLRSGECIGCEACVDTCPRGSLSRPALDPARHFVLSALVRSALFFGMGVCLGFCRF